MDLQFLRPLFDGDGDVASVHLDTSRGTADSDKQIELRWRAARSALAEQGADADALAALDGVVGGARDVPGPQGEALFASGGRVLAVHTMSEPPSGDTAVNLPVADPLPLALDRDHQLAHVVVAVDREGADVDAYPAAAAAPSFQRTFNGSTLHITRVRAGAVSHAAYHRRSVNLWSENTEQVAEDVREAAAEVEAAVILIAGDPKAIGLLRDHLSTRPPRGVGPSTSRAAEPTSRRSTCCGRASTRRCTRP
ncbi:Vms1/Ankzf1 family peptidyl-tRNA hydrolase [Saccharopolyspora sp. ID03-671]|uniref:baeRF2 domain-containing protein n=1 Tax=Saccharopolyspora sp. ID03-671 TaxID=3073066 RepID=UPI0032508A14